jgi:hypothetical protein
MPTCLKCGYVRQPTDDASPAGVCPRCGVAYAKAQPGSAPSTAARPQTTTRADDALVRGAGVTFVYLVTMTIAALSVLGGLSILFTDRRLGVVGLLVGFSSAALLVAVGLGLRYLHGIYLNTLKR